MVRQIFALYDWYEDNRGEKKYDDRTMIKVQLLAEWSIFFILHMLTKIIFLLQLLDGLIFFFS